MLNLLKAIISLSSFNTEEMGEKMREIEFVSLLTAAIMGICGSQRLGTHSEVCRCGDVGGVERIQSTSASHIEQPGLLLQQQGAVVPGRAGETSTAQETCRDMTHIVTTVSPL